LKIKDVKDILAGRNKAYAFQNKHAQHNCRVTKPSKFELKAKSENPSFSRYRCFYFRQFFKSYKIKPSNL